ncbi:MULTISPECIES: hypothetical protein [unclassified Coleofasciculus]|uniref:hypothetical protein n=1 Tax=unclassified Coleofasciculus TaxID=2692782 RepID=UPI00188267D2|nr:MULTISPECIES: hypothetical protein [unclassified Coleofasciculus]MBE9128845.1 hypothetical protein [Coleofasciculus sp. LEGE 07081]MBE9151531.1 hypothetical protein [Coleofasciculus sp. LEGE 07092]
MTSNFRINPPMQNPSTDRYTQPTAANPYCPSVPISVYRELAAELQAAQAMLDSLNGQNKQLVKQNQQLRQEVENVLKSAQHLQQVVDSFSPVSGVEMPRRKPVMSSEARLGATASTQRGTANVPVVEFPPPNRAPESSGSPYRETLVIEQEDTRSRRTSSSEGFSEVNGWFLIVAIVLIVLTAFGTGFLIVRPLLNNNNNNR